MAYSVCLQSQLPPTLDVSASGNVTSIVTIQTILIREKSVLRRHKKSTTVVCYVRSIFSPSYILLFNFHQTLTVIFLIIIRVVMLGYNNIENRGKSQRSVLRGNSPGTIRKRHVKITIEKPKYFKVIYIGLLLWGEYK